IRDFHVTGVQTCALPISLTVAWAKELARYSIRVNAIAPGFIATEMVASMRPDVLDKIAAGIPAGRLGRPDEIAHAALFLLENDRSEERRVGEECRARRTA